jgi:hypothetical protein
MERPAFITTDPEAVRREHAAAHRRLMFVLKRNGEELSEDGRKLFQHVAFSLYVDSRSIDAITPISDVVRPREWPSSP